MAKRFYGIVGIRNNRWMLEVGGQMFWTEHLSLAKARLLAIDHYQSGGPFEIREIGPEGEPIRLSEKKESE